MRLGRLVLSTLLLGGFLGTASAQTTTTPADRQARLKEHERRIREIIERRRAEEQAKESGQAPPPEDTPPPPEEEPKDEPRGAVSSVVMGFKFTNVDGDTAYNTIVREKDSFLTEVYLFNIDGNPIERVRLALDYDKRFIEPERVFDATLRPFMDGNPKFEHDTREGVINYDVKLKTKLTNPEVVVLRILWKALRETPYTGIDFHFDPLEREDQSHTAIFAQGTNILGTRDDPMDGVLSGGLMIDIPEGKTPVLQGKAEELQTLYLGSVASRDKVGLELVGPRSAPRVGEAFKVSVRVNNPEGALIDAVNTFVRFDPEVMQVIDVDKFNYIHRGTNVHDGPYHRNFPWDMHKKNEIRNDRGFVSYQASLSNGASLPSKTMYDIYFRAIAPMNETELYFVKGKLSDAANTSIRYFGYERLDLETEISSSTIKMPILPAPPEVAQATPETTTATEIISPVAEPDRVQKLKIERDPTE
ncbi:hypothetical protein GC173_04825 [bacterium]|nr:hypothetical protein [bacterium]